MLTLFSIPKAFKGHIGIIQRNAIKSWTMLDPNIEIILFGDDEGTGAVAREFGLRHEPKVERNEFGTILVNYVFAKAQAMARYHSICYVNCDIILMQDFCHALVRIQAARTEFLMVGQRWDVDIRTPLPFEDNGWQAELRNLISRQGKKRGPDWIDYFAFSRGLYGSGMPAFAIGRTSWDNWLVWQVLDMKKPVVDATPVVVAVHQNHDYSHHPEGKHGAWHGEEARRNARLAGGRRRLRTVADATLVTTQSEIRANSRRYWMFGQRFFGSIGRFLIYRVWHPAWFAILDVTRPLRTALGLRKAS